MELNFGIVEGLPEETPVLQWENYSAGSESWNCTSVWDSKATDWLFLGCKNRGCIGSQINV